MGLPERIAPTPPEVSPPAEHCPYCGARLNPFFYFCLVCATPYKDVELVLPPSQPVRPTDGMLIAAKAPQVAPMFWTYFAVVVATAILAHLVFGERRLDLALAFQMLCLFVTTCVFGALHWPSLAVQLRRLGLFQPAALASVLALAALMLAGYLYHGWLIERLGLRHEVLLNRLRTSGLGKGTLIFCFCVFPALTEETAFRGLLQHWLQTAIPARRAIILAAALFTALHFSILSAPYLFAVGLLLGWAKWKTGSLYPPMAIHFLHNLVALELFRF